METKLNQILEYLEAQLVLANRNRAYAHDEGHWYGYYTGQHDNANKTLRDVAEIIYRGKEKRCEDCNHSHVVIRDTPLGKAIVQGIIECRIDDPIKGTRINPIEYPIVTNGKPCYRYTRKGNR